MIPLPSSMRSPLTNSRYAQYVVLRQRAHQGVVKRESIRALARLFSEVDAEQRQYNRATRLAEAAAIDVESERFLHAQGSIPVDLLPDAIKRSTRRQCAKAEHRQDCDELIIAIEETKGTLLQDEGIAIVDNRGLDVSSTLVIDKSDPAGPLIFSSDAWRVTPLERGDPTILSICEFQEDGRYCGGAGKHVVPGGGGSLRRSIAPLSSSWALPPGPTFPGSGWFELHRARFR